MLNLLNPILIQLFNFSNKKSAFSFAILSKIRRMITLNFLFDKAETRIQLRLNSGLNFII